MGTFRGFVSGSKRTLKEAHMPWSRPLETGSVVMSLVWRADMTRLAISLLPTCGYFSLLVLAGCALYLNRTFGAPL